MSHSDIAAVITCYNLGRTLEEALRSIQTQTVPPTELLIVDDGSTDIFTRQVIRRLVRSGCRVLETANRGVSAARNTGIRSTKSSIIAVLDGDDWLDARYFEQAVDLLNDKPELSFVSCGVACFGDSDEIWIPTDLDLVNALISAPLHVSTLFRRTLWQAVGGFDESLGAHEELDFWVSALERGFRGTVIREPLLHYRVRGASMARSSLTRRVYVPLLDRIRDKHANTIRSRVPAVLAATERFIEQQREHHQFLSRREQEAADTLRSLRSEIADLSGALQSFGQSRVDFGDLRRVSPISPVWGLDRGKPLDRYYIEGFLEAHRDDIRGRVLELKDPGYTRQFGGSAVTESDVLDIDASNPDATLIADLTNCVQIPDNTYDCFILTQTLGEIVDPAAALKHAYRILKPGGTLLCTVPACGRISYENDLDHDMWRFTQGSVRHIFARAFPIESFDVTGFGNVLAASAFLYGLSPDELTRAELDTHDPYFPVVYGIRASKSHDRPAAALLTPHCSDVARSDQPAVGVILMYHRVTDEPTSSGNMTLTTLKGQLRCLSQQGYNVVPLSAFRDLAALPPRALALTFDDGYEESLHFVAPLLQEFGFPATFFVTAGPLVTEEREFWWDRLARVFDSSAALPATITVKLATGSWRLPTVTALERRAVRERIATECIVSDLGARRALLDSIASFAGQIELAERPSSVLDAAGVEALSRCAGMNIGAHGVDHLWLPALSSIELHSETAGARAALEKTLAHTVETFAYPYGAADERALGAVHDAGFEVAVTSQTGDVHLTSDTLRLPRQDASRWTADQLQRELDRAFSNPRDGRRHGPGGPRVLVVGWFSYDGGNATAGDVLARDLAVEWLGRAGVMVDVAFAAPFTGSLRLQEAEPLDYSHVLFVCGPFERRPQLEGALLERFSHAKILGLNLSMEIPLSEWDPFDVLLERDSSRHSRPDIVFLTRPPKVPVVGMCLVEDYEGGRTESAREAFSRLLRSNEMSVVNIDTRLDENRTGLRTVSEITSVIAKMDALLTTRLHGLAFALMHSVPAIVLDTRSGGGKVIEQARSVGWPWAFLAETVTDVELQQALSYCLSQEARTYAQCCAERAQVDLERIPDLLLDAMRS
jgi:peptidoglycan/xylan/chitin deacetylase (PgdA/CDA1 family)/SAM-dependent methyltransferase